MTLDEFDGILRGILSSDGKGQLGLDLVDDRGGKALGINQFTDITLKFRRSIFLAAEFSTIATNLLQPRDGTGAVLSTYSLIEYLSRRFSTPDFLVRTQGAMEGLGHILERPQFSSNRLISGGPDKIEVDFIGAFRINPTYQRWLIGGSIAIVCLVACMYGVAAVSTTYSGSKCLEVQEQVLSKSIGAISSLTHPEPKLAEQQMNAIQQVAKVAAMGAAACVRPLPSVDFRLHNPPSSWEASIGER